MVRYYSTKDLIQIGIMCIVLLGVFLYCLIEFIIYIRNRKRFYEDYIACYQPKENGLGADIGGLFLKLLALIVAIIEGKNLIRFGEDTYYLEVFLGSTVLGLVILSMVLELISTVIHMRTMSGISPNCISVNSLFLPKNKVVYEESENEIIIYRKSNKKIKGAKLASQVYDISRDRGLLNYLHIYYQKIDSNI